MRSESRLVLFLAVLGLLASGTCPSCCRTSASAAERISGGEISRALTTLLAASDRGAGAPAAAQAWRKLITADAADILVLLDALDQAQPIAANWVRSAIDAIAERQLADGKPLPTAELEKFVRNASRPPVARRLAYEWLAKVDATTPERLLPGMLNDPSLELRRDAVERVLQAANEEFDAGRKDAALPLYRQAMDSARDLDQVTKLETRLKELGHKIDLARHFGYLQEWKLIGPFDNTGSKGFAVAYPPETSIDYGATLAGKEGSVTWIDHVTSDPRGVVDLNKALSKHMGAAGYAVAEFESDRAQQIELRLCCVCANKIWLNGRLLASNDVYHAGEEFDQYVAPGQLQAGKNVILLKICQNEMTESWAQDWRFGVRVCDANGTAVLAQNRPAPGEAP